jgi:LysM repeat protein
LSTIADAYGLPLETLMDVNGISDPNSVQAGQVLRIPDFAVDIGGGDVARGPAVTGTPAETTEAEAPPVVDQGVAGDSGLRHFVLPGEWLSTIAPLYGVAVDALATINRISNPDFIVAGSTLVIPGGSSGAAPVADVPVSSNTSPGGSVHVVSVGETLSSIAAMYGVTLSRLADANNLANHDIIVLGESLLIPDAATPSQTTGYSDTPSAPPSGNLHVVQPGETLSALAATFGVSLDALLAVNSIANPNFVVAGETLQIPGGGGSGAPASATAAEPVSTQTHVVAEGETLATIAANYGVPASSIIDVNGLANPNLIVAGQPLEIPGVILSRGYSLDEYAIILENAAAEFGISAALIKGLAWHESGWNQNATSWAGAVGVMQVMPYTADWALATIIPDATAWESDPMANARMGAAILHHWLVRSDWNVETSLAAYYQGWRSLHEIGMYDETKVYIQNVLANVAEFEQ